MAYALITGASAGLGVEFAKQLAAKGYHLILVARDSARLNALAEAIETQFQVKAHPVVSDLSQNGSATTLQKICHDHHWTVDLLVNNAGVGMHGPFVLGDSELLKRMLHLNMTTLVELTQAFGRPMAQRGGGAILNVASVAAYLPGPYMAAYYATKAFVLSFSEALSIELKDSGVQVTAHCPGPTRTEFFVRAGMTLTGVKGKFAASPEDCVRRGLAGLFAGRPVVVDGLSNQLVVFLLRFLPRNFAGALSARIIGRSAK